MNAEKLHTMSRDKIIKACKIHASKRLTLNLKLSDLHNTLLHQCAGVLRKPTRMTYNYETIPLWTDCLDL